MEESALPQQVDAENWELSYYAFCSQMGHMIAVLCATYKSVLTTWHQILRLFLVSSCSPQKMDAALG